MNASQCYGRSTNQDRPVRLTVETAQLNGHNFEHNSFVIAERDCNIHDNRMSSRRNNHSSRTHDRVIHSPYKSDTDINESVEFTVGIVRVNRSNSFHCHSNSSYIWENNAPPKPPYHWSKTFSQLRDDWSSLARTNFANRGYSRVRSRSVGLPTGCEDSMRPGCPTPGEVRMMFGRATITEVPEYASSPSMLLDPPDYEDQPVRLQNQRYKNDKCNGETDTQSSIPHDGAFPDHYIDSPNRETNFMVRKKEIEEPINSCNCTNCRYTETSDMSIIKSIKKVSEWVMSSSFGKANRHNNSNTDQSDSANPTGFYIDLSRCNYNKETDSRECRKRKQLGLNKDNEECGNKPKLKAYLRGSYRESSPPQNRLCVEEEVYESCGPATNNKCSTVLCENSFLSNLRHCTGKECENSTRSTLRKRVISEKPCSKNELQRNTNCSLCPSRNRSSSRTQVCSKNLLSSKRKCARKSPFRNNFQSREIEYGPQTKNEYPPITHARSRKVKQGGIRRSSSSMHAGTGSIELRREHRSRSKSRDNMECSQESCFRASNNKENCQKSENCSKSSRPKTKLLRCPSLSDCYEDDRKSDTCRNANVLPSCPPGFVDICPLDPCMRKSIPRVIEVVHCPENGIGVCPLDPCKNTCPRIYEMVHCSTECSPIEICPLDPCRNVSPIFDASKCQPGSIPLQVCPLDPCRYICPQNTLAKCTPEVQDTVWSKVTKCPPDHIDICPLDPHYPIGNCLSITQPVTCTNSCAQNEMLPCPPQVCADILSPAPQCCQNACRLKSCQTIIHSTLCRCAQCIDACNSCAGPSEELDCNQSPSSKHVQFSCYKTCYDDANNNPEYRNCVDNCNKCDNTHPGEPCCQSKLSVSTVPLCSQNKVIRSPVECSQTSCCNCKTSACCFRTCLNDQCRNQIDTSGDTMDPTCTRHCNYSSDLINSCTTKQRCDSDPNPHFTSDQCCNSNPNPSGTIGQCCYSEINTVCTEGQCYYSTARSEHSCGPFCCNNTCNSNALAECCENPCERVQCCCVPPCPVENNVLIKIVLPDEPDLPAPKPPPRPPLSPSPSPPRSPSPLRSPSPSPPFSPPAPPLSPSPSPTPEPESLESIVTVISNITPAEFSDSEEEVVEEVEEEDEEESSDEEEPERLEVRVKSETTIDGVKRESSLTLVIETVESSDTESDESIPEPAPLESVPVSLNSAPQKKREPNPWLIYLVVLLLLLAAMLAYCLFKKYCARQRFHRECFCKNVCFW